MTDTPRFTIELRIRDRFGEADYVMAIGCDEALRISTRAVEELKFGLCTGIAEAVGLMRTREMRRDLLRSAAKQLAGAMADRMEDAEGWHDPSRIELSRKALGGKW